jgi:defect-in-organelle-trafficking protein DotB
MVSAFEPNERSERAYALMESLRLIVTQTLVSKVSGGRLGVREWMRFDDSVRDKLMDMDFKDWPAEIGRMVPFYGQSMARSAEIFFEAGEIDRKTYIMLSNSTGSS